MEYSVVFILSFKNPNAILYKHGPVCKLLVWTRLQDIIKVN